MKFFNNFKISLIISSILLVSVSNCFAQSFSKGDITIETPWTRATPKGSKVAGAYMHIINKGDKEDKFLGLTSPVCHHSEVHEMAIIDGIMKMRELRGGLVIPAHKDVMLKPGSYHVMFMGINQPFIKGSKIPVILHFQNAGDIPISFPVEALGSTRPTTISMGH